jgi:hypothetical protein
MELGQVAVLLVFVLFIAAFVKSRRKRNGRRYAPGSGAAGAIHDMLIEDKRKAIEIIVEEKAEQRDPETADGNLPDLESPKRP